MPFSRVSLLSIALLAAATLASAGQTVPLPVLPQIGTVFVVEGTNAPVQIHASEMKFNGHSGSNFARSFVYAGPHRTMELVGPTANLTLHTSTPVFYVRLGDGDPEIARNRVELLHLGVDGKDRSVVTFTNNTFGGSQKRHETAVPITKSDTADQLVLQVKSSAALEPGEYAIAFMPADQVEAPTIVYDFTISATPTH